MDSKPLSVDPQGIPVELQERPQWVLWKYVADANGEHRKVPHQVNGQRAKSSDPATWSTFDACWQSYERGGWHGIGYVFAADDPFIGIDLDSCITSSGEIEPWASALVDSCGGTYAELSPSGTGVKLWAKSAPLFSKGKNVKLPEYGEINGRVAGIEIYSEKRFFCLTGRILTGADREPQPLPEAGALALRQAVERGERAEQAAKEKSRPAVASSPAVSVDYKPSSSDAVRRASAYVAKVPGAISGNHGSDDTFEVCCVLAEFGLDESDAWRILINEFNPKCDPHWSEAELRHKLDDAYRKVRGEGRFGSRLSESRGPSDGSISFGGGTSSPTADDKPPEFTQLMTSSDFDSHEFKQTYIVKSILVEGQPCVVGGAEKSLKTSITVDLALSLATGTAFLGQFPTERRRTAFWSAESGGKTLQGLARRIVAAKGVRLGDADLFWSFCVPRLSRLQHLNHFERVIVERGVQVAIVDPLYLALLSDGASSDASNLYAMGSRLLPLSEIGQRSGCTIIVLHHFRKMGRDAGGPAGLEMLSQAGVAEWARQWILSTRRSEFQHDGRHELYLGVGGSAGHSGAYAVDVDEGYWTEAGDQRYWSVTISDARDAATKQRREESARKERERQDKQAAQSLTDQATVHKVMREIGKPETPTGVRNRTGLRNDRFCAAVASLESSGYVTRTTITKDNGRSYEALAYNPEPGRVTSTVLNNEPTAFNFGDAVSVWNGDEQSNRTTGLIGTVPISPAGPGEHAQQQDRPAIY